jgi:hypothetical protein
MADALAACMTTWTFARAQIVRWALVLAIAPGCEADDRAPPVEPAADASAADDAAVPPADAAPPPVDGAPSPTDASPIDASPIDGSPIDASPIDASPIDGSPDDAATTPDAGSGAMDAGVAPSIIEPPDGTALRARRQTFAWTGAGSDYRVRVGTAPGAADLHESPPLGDATSLTVDDLPLTGVPIYVQLLSGPPDARVSTMNRYQAPMRRGLAVIVDFADRRLEDHRGGGMKSLADVATQLRAMEAHWDWLSRGREKAEWEVIRVKLEQDMTPWAFPYWWDFRDEVVRQTLKQVRLADHDVNSDGVLDAIWAIVSNGDTELRYVIGGASRHLGAAIFVDGQASLSVQVGATGNFNHEFAHTMELPDLYGPYGTLGDLTVMASSWPTPPNDFTAFERVHLGWVEPVVIGETTADVLVPKADDHMFALKIETPYPGEHFLIEYRTPPGSGFGSAGPAYEGLAVYHVSGAPNQHFDPPRLKLEPADGSIVPDTRPEATDFVYPENPAMRLPLVFRNYVTGYPVFQIDAVRRTAGGAMAIDLTVAPQRLVYNLVDNGSVEESTAGWTTGGLQADEASFIWASIVPSEGQRSLSIASSSDCDAEWKTRVDTVPGRRYVAHAWMLTRDVVGGVGATISLSGTSIHSRSAHGTRDDCCWLNPSIEFTATSTSVEVACRLGGVGALSRGQMWCDDVEVNLIRSAFYEDPPAPAPARSSRPGR